MSDFLGRLAQRVVAPAALLQPRVLSLFEAPAPAGTDHAERDDPRPPAERLEASAPYSAERHAVGDQQQFHPPGESLEAMSTEVAASDALTPPSDRTALTPRPALTPERPFLTRRAAEPDAMGERRQLLAARESLEAMSMEIAASEALAPHPAPALTPRPRAVMRRATERRRAAAALDVAEGAPPRGERDVHITIGRIDVRAVTPPARQRDAPKTPRTLTLDDYLAQRGRR